MDKKEFSLLNGDNGNTKKLKQLIEKTQTGIDGNIVSLEQYKTFSFKSEPNFIKIYLDNILYLTDMPNNLSSLMFELLKVLTYADRGHRIILNATIKKEIASRLKISEQSLRNQIHTLKKGKILYQNPSEIGVYYVNPYLFGKGDWEDISKIREIKIEVAYSMEGKSFTTVVSKEDIKEIQKIEKVYKAT